MEGLRQSELAKRIRKRAKRKPRGLLEREAFGWTTSQEGAGRKAVDQLDFKTSVAMSSSIGEGAAEAQPDTHTLNYPCGDWFVAMLGMCDTEDT